MNRDQVSLYLLILFLSHYCLASPYKHLQTEKHAPPIILAGEQVASQDIMLLLLNLSQRCLQQFWQSKHRAIRGQRLCPHKRRKRTLMAFAACSGQFLFKVCVPFCWFKQTHWGWSILPYIMTPNKRQNIYIVHPNVKICAAYAHILYNVILLLYAECYDL